MYLKLRNTTIIFYQAIEIVVNCIRKRCQQKDHIETLQKLAILLLKALHDEESDHKLQQISSLFSSELHKFNLETQLETLTNIVNQKQAGIKDSKTINYLLNAS